MIVEIETPGDLTEEELAQTYTFVTNPELTVWCTHQLGTKGLAIVGMDTFLHEGLRFAHNSVLVNSFSPSERKVFKHPLGDPPHVIHAYRLTRSIHERVQVD
jgi:hypothetical protein